MPASKKDLETARKLFEEGGWGSGDPYGPDQWFSDDAVMRDIVGHEDALRGKDEIRKFWASQKVGITLCSRRSPWGGDPVDGLCPNYGPGK